MANDHAIRLEQRHQAQVARGSMSKAVEAMRIVATPESAFEGQATNSQFDEAHCQVLEAALKVVSSEQALNIIILQS